MNVRSLRGSVLAHVLVTGVIVAVIAAGMLRMALLRFTAAQRAISGAQARREADGLLNVAVSNWNAVSTVCSSNPPYLTCAPSSAAPPGVCNCACPSATALPRIVVTGGGAPPCTVTVVSSDPQ